MTVPSMEPLTWRKIYIYANCIKKTPGLSFKAAPSDPRGDVCQDVSKHKGSIQHKVFTTIMLYRPNALQCHVQT